MGTLKFNFNFLNKKKNYFLYQGFMIQVLFSFSDSGWFWVKIYIELK